MAWEILFEGVLFVMETVTFIQFIYEEAIQSGSLAGFMLLRAGKKAQAVQAIQAVINGPIAALHQFNTEYGWLAPYSQACFNSFYEMALMSNTYQLQVATA